MSVTQYIGSRYVPVFADPAEWNASRTYEPLTIVLHEGNSYTSKQFVPVGIDIANDDFWAETGNYNAQVEAYRQEILRISKIIPESKFSEKNTVYDNINKFNEFNEIPLYAHRGYTRTSNIYGFDNTIQSVQIAKANGFKGCEIDVQTDINGIIVCFHDDTVDAITNGSGPMINNDYSTLRFKSKLNQQPSPVKVNTVLQLLIFAKFNNMKILLDGHYINGAYVTPMVSPEKLLEIVYQSGIQKENISFYEWDDANLAKFSDYPIYFEMPVSEVSQDNINKLIQKFPEAYENKTLGVRMQLIDNENQYITALDLLLQNKIRVMGTQLGTQITNAIYNNPIYKNIDGIIADYPMTPIDDSIGEYRIGGMPVDGPRNHYNQPDIISYMNSLKHNNSFYGGCFSSDVSKFIPETDTRDDIYGALLSGFKYYDDGLCLIANRSKDANSAYLNIFRHNNDKNTNEFIWKNNIGKYFLNLKQNNYVNDNSTTLNEFIKNAMAELPDSNFVMGYMKDALAKEIFTDIPNAYGTVYFSFQPIKPINDLTVTMFFTRNPQNLNIIYCYTLNDTSAYKIVA